MRTIDVIPGQPNAVTINDSHPASVTVSSPLIDVLLSDLRLNVLTIGQTRWNIGGAELRHHLFVNGVRATRNVDYTINLPYLDWLAPVTLEPADELVLTY